MRKFTKEHRKKLSEAHKGQRPWMKGKKHSEETKEIIRQKALEQFKDGMPEETKLKMKGRKAWNKGLKGVMPEPWNKGIKKPTNTGKTWFKKGNKPPTDELSPNWKGDKAGYCALHDWVRKHKGKAKICSKCNTTVKKIEWANVDHKYRRNLDDFISLCCDCHSKYDKQHKLNKLKEKIYGKRIR